MSELTAGAEQQDRPQVSVIIACHNSAATIGLQLQGLWQQQGAPGFEVVLVDNRSTDDLAAVVAAWAGRLALRLVSAPTLANPGYARNVGVGASWGELLLFCDSDDFVGPNWVGCGVAALEQSSIVNGGASPIAGTEFDFGAEHLQSLLPDLLQPDLVVPSEPESYPILLGGSCGFTREAFLAIGGYDVAMPYGIEDNDLALRAQAAGYLIARCQAMGLAYRMRSAADNTLQRAFLSGYRHLLLAHRYQLFGRSPSLGSRWYLESFRCLGAAVKMVLRPERRDWPSLARRFATALGALTGQVWYGWFRRIPAARVGVGLTELAQSNERDKP